HQDERRKVCIKPLQQRAAIAEGALWDFDGAGFCFTPCLPSAWPPRGSPIEIPTSSHRQRVNVRGFLNRNNEFVPSMSEGKVDAPLIVTCVDHLSPQLPKQTDVCIENAPMHRSQALIKHMPQGVKKGLMVQYLPSY